MEEQVRGRLAALDVFCTEDVSLEALPQPRSAAAGKESTMTEDVSAATGIVGALRDGVAAAKRDGAKSVQASPLSPEQLDALAASTLVHLRSRPRSRAGRS